MQNLLYASPCGRNKKKNEARGRKKGGHRDYDFFKKLVFNKHSISVFPSLNKKLN